MNEHNYKPGDKVRFIDAAAHEQYPTIFPEAGTECEVIKDYSDSWGDIFVKWCSVDSGNTFCKPYQVEPVEEDEA